MNYSKAFQKDEQILITFIHKVVNTLSWSQGIPNSIGTLKVKKGWVTLEDELSCPYHREVTTLLVNNLASVEDMPCAVIAKGDTQPKLSHQPVEQVFLQNRAVHKPGIQVD